MSIYLTILPLKLRVKQALFLTAGSLLLTLTTSCSIIETWINQSYSVDSEKVEAAARKIMDYNIPGGSQGVMTMNIAGLGMSVITSKSDPEAITLMLATFPKDGSNTDSIKKQLKEASNQPDIAPGAKTKTESRRLCGQLVDVIIMSGKTETEDPKTNGKDYLVYQSLLGHNQKQISVTLTATGSQASQDIEQVFSSLQCK